MDATYLLRAFIADVNDPERRGRVRVRIPQIHPEQTPDGHLPWAEDAMYAGTGFGDFRTWKKGDTVFVGFEAGRVDLPVVLGGWSKGGDHPSESYPTRDVWIRQDRFGNRVTFDARPNQEKIVVESGTTRIFIDADGLLTINANRVRVIADDTVSLSGDEITLTAQRINLNADESVNIDSPDVNIETDTLDANTESVDIRSSATYKVRAVNVDVQEIPPI